MNFCFLRSFYAILHFKRLFLCHTFWLTPLLGGLTVLLLCFCIFAHRGHGYLCALPTTPCPTGGGWIPTRLFILSSLLLLFLLLNSPIWAVDTCFYSFFSPLAHRGHGYLLFTKNVFLGPSGPRIPAFSLFPCPSGPQVPGLVFFLAHRGLGYLL